MIPRYQRVLFYILLGSSLLMAASLFYLHHRRMVQLAAIGDATPLFAPSTTPAESVTLLLANDADGALTPTREQLALPAEPSARARALLERLLAEYALPGSSHPLPGGDSVDDVFLLPAVAPDPASPNPPDPSQLAVVNLHGAFVLGHPSGVLAEMLTLQSILGTLHANLPLITQVRFLVDGQQLQTLAGHADLSRVYSTETTQPESGTP